MKQQRKNQLAKRRAKLNQRRGVTVAAGMRVDEAEGITRYDRDREQAVRGELSTRRLFELLEAAAERRDNRLVRLCCQGIMDLGKADGDLYAISGLAAMKCGRPHLALRDLKRAVESGDVGANVRQAASSLKVVEEAMELMETPQAILDCHTAQELHNANCANDRINEYADLTAVEVAHRYTKSMVSKFPRFSPILNNYVNLSIILGQFEEADRVACQVSSQFPDDPFAHANLAHVKWWSGDLETCGVLLQNLPPIRESRREALSHAMEAAYKNGEPLTVIKMLETHEEIQDALRPMELDRDLCLVAWAYDRIGMEDAKNETLNRISDQFENAAFIKDLSRPLEQRVGECPISPRSWLPVQLTNLLKRVGDRSEQPAIMIRFLAGFPHLFEALLDRGPGVARRAILQVLQANPFPTDFLAILARFVESEFALPEDREIASGILAAKQRRI